MIDSEYRKVPSTSNWSPEEGKDIVIEAYNFSLDAFGKQGGAAVIDDISYNASAIYECKLSEVILNRFSLYIKALN
uniref:Ig-like domain-containing protein n=1 Tax=Heterorhabditis bacteriophora TaxID=37862 RepID=A0A1I7XVR6_HETBA